MDTLYIVMPAYNEEENITQVLLEWYPIIERHNGNGTSRLVVVNDGSKDHTKDIITEFAKTHPLVIPITKDNSGHGPTLRFAYDYAISHGADYVFQTDSDGQTKANEFEPFWELRETYDFIGGWRNHRQDGLSRIIVTRVLRALTNILYHTNLKDSNVPYRLMNAKKLKMYLPLIPKDYFLINVVLSVIFSKNPDKMLYIPITFQPRSHGVNSINMKRIFQIGIRFIKDFRVINERISSL